MRVLLLSAAFLFGLIVMGFAAAASAQQGAAEDRHEVSTFLRAHLIYVRRAEHLPVR